MVLKVLYAAVQTIAAAVAAWMGWKVQPSCDCTSGHIDSLSVTA